MGKTQTRPVSKKNSPRQIPPAPVPEGFTRADSGFPQSWDFEREPVVQGHVVRIRTVELKYGKQVRETRVMEVAVDGEPFSVWESAALTELFDAVSEGDEVWIRYTGQIQVKGRRQPMRGFQAAYRSQGAESDRG